MAGSTDGFSQGQSYGSEFTINLGTLRPVA